MFRAEADLADDVVLTQRVRLDLKTLVRKKLVSKAGRGAAARYTLVGMIGTVVLVCLCTRSVWQVRTFGTKVTVADAQLRARGGRFGGGRGGRVGSVLY